MALLSPRKGSGQGWGRDPAHLVADKKWGAGERGNGLLEACKRPAGQEQLEGRVDMSLQASCVQEATQWAHRLGHRGLSTPSSCPSFRPAACLLPAACQLVLVKDRALPLRSRLRTGLPGVWWPRPTVCHARAPRECGRIYGGWDKSQQDHPRGPVEGPGALWTGPLTAVTLAWWWPRLISP